MEEDRHRVSISNSGPEPASLVSTPLSRGIVVLIYIWHHPGVSLSAIHRGTSMPKSSLVRILRTLLATRAVTEDPDGGYRTGPGFSDTTVIDVDRLKDLCHPVLVTLAEEFGETVGLFWIDGNTRVCVDAVESPNEVRRVLLIGQRRPLDVGCTAAAALAFAPYPRLPQVIPQYTPHTITDPEAIRASWEDVRRLGFAITHNQTYLGVSGVAAPIMPPDGAPFAVISVTGPEVRFRSNVVQQWGQRLLATCRKFSAQIAGSEEL